MALFDVFEMHEAQEEFARDVRLGLGRSGQKTLPSKHLYDSLGSALFEAITHLPEYGLTRADERVLRELAPALPDLLPGAVRVAELGSGTGTKTRCILEALADGVQVPYHPIDLSASALAACRVELRGLCLFEGHLAPYSAGLQEVVARREDHERLLVLFLGSNIGNFSYDEAARFLCGIRRALRGGDALLLGADLLKPIPELLLAYDDPTGVTAAFNKNLLGRINRELGGEFHLPAFAHEARYSSENQSVEMHLRALRRQEVFIEGAGLSVRFEEGETIWTEASRKFTSSELDELGLNAGFKPCGRWIDSEWPFAECFWLVP
jgi:dimethylhistidine N-methyltransferase